MLNIRIDDIAFPPVSYVCSNNFTKTPLNSDCALVEELSVQEMLSKFCTLCSELMIQWYIKNLWFYIYFQIILRLYIIIANSYLLTIWDFQGCYYLFATPQLTKTYDMPHTRMNDIPTDIFQCTQSVGIIVRQMT